MTTQTTLEEMTIETRAKAPTPKDFVVDSFLPHMGMHCASQPRTLEFWTQATARPLAFARGFGDVARFLLGSECC